MKILHVCETARGGVGTYIDTLVALCRPSDLQQVVLPEQHRSMLAKAVDCQTFPYPRRSVLSFLRMLWVACVARIRFKPDIIFCHSSFSLFSLIFLKPISPRVSFVYCSHGWAGLRQEPGSWKARITCRIEGLLCGIADRVINVSQFEFDHAHKNAYHGVHLVIENAVLPSDGPARPKWPANCDDADALNLLFVGRHDFEKGLDVLLDAFHEARVQRPDLRLRVIGEAVLSDMGRNCRADAGPYNDSVSWLGWLERDAIDAHYQSADLVVVPSRREGLPLVIPEALRNGTPVLVSDRSGLPRLITPGKTGMICELNSHALAKVLIGLRKSELAGMRQACAELFRTRYHADRLGREVHELYASLTRGRDRALSREKP